jgi:hypothetical protein
MQASNILVCRGSGSVKLSDLGVAAKLDRRFSAAEPEKFAELTRRNTFIGSPAYMAPEVICADKGCATVCACASGAGHGSVLVLNGAVLCRCLQRCEPSMMQCCRWQHHWTGTPCMHACREAHWTGFWQA